MDITLRAATLDDLALIDDMHVKSRRVTYRGHVSDHYLDVTMRGWRRLLREEHLWAGETVGALLYERALT